MRKKNQTLLDSSQFGLHCMLVHFQAIQQSAALQIPDEPEENSEEPVARLRFRTPTGEVKLRRFRASEPLRNVLFYLTSEGFHIEDYKILTTFPRRDVSLDVV